ncbi:MAG: hypothetical protein JNM17_36930 [Archangium sp.]|nr:hypothetical protein [Archangium sp.]
MTRREEVDRSFEGKAVLEKLLTQSGSVADAEDVAGAFKKAIEEGVPAPVVIQALWEDEPRFETPDDAARLFGNLLGLYDLISEGKKVDLGSAATAKVKREKATKPEPYDAKEGPTDAFIESAWRYFDDFPKERQKFEHAFENRQDMLILWLDDSGLDDASFALARHLVGEVFAMLELGGRKLESINESMVPKKATLEALPRALSEWIEDTLYEAETDDEKPLPKAEVEKVRGVVARAVNALWSR